MRYYATPVDCPSHGQVAVAASDFTYSAVSGAPRREVVARGVGLGLLLLAAYLCSTAGAPRASW